MKHYNFFLPLVSVSTIAMSCLNSAQIKYPDNVVSEPDSVQCVDGPNRSQCTLDEFFKSDEGREILAKNGVKYAYDSLGPHGSLEMYFRIQEPGSMQFLRLIMDDPISYDSYDPRKQTVLVYLIDNTNFCVSPEQLNIEQRNGLFQVYIDKTAVDQVLDRNRLTGENRKALTDRLDFDGREGYMRIRPKQGDIVRILKCDFDKSYLMSFLQE
jgi:hypothetical protein